MKNIIVQVCIKGKKVGDIEHSSMHSYTEELYNTCCKDAQEYAEKIGCEYHKMTESEYSEDWMPTYQRFALWKESYGNYDNIVYMDADYAPNKFTMPDIFSVMESSRHSFFAVPDNRYDPKSGEMKKTKRKIYDKCNLHDDYKYFNAGIVCMKREFINETKDIVDDYVLRSKSWELFDQDALNTLIHDKYFNYGTLSKEWNGVFSVDEPNFAIHYAGMTKQKFTVEKHRKLQEKKLLSDQIWHKFDPRVDKVEAPSLEGFI